MKCKPTKQQLEFLQWELGVFFHFGIRTYYEGYRDWDMQPMDLSAFQPTELDCRQWMRVMQEAGAKYAVLVTKHHDGFANWPSQYSDYTIAQTSWKEGKGDLVGDFVAACREYQIKVGLYYSPAEYALKEKKRVGIAYDDYVISQVRELLTNYGTIDYLWFDGCGSEGHVYDKGRIAKEIRKLQPDILIFNMFDPDVRWIGNEVGLAPSPCFNTVESVDFSVQTTDQEALRESKWLSAECDCRMRQDNWYYSDLDEDTVKSVDELMGMYDYSVGRGANLLINIGPDRRGLLPEADSQRLIEFGQELQRRFQEPIAAKEQFARKENTWVFKMQVPCLINHLVAEEDLTEGEAVQKYRIQIKPYSFGKPITVWEGYNIGNKAICKFPTVFTNEVILEILEADGEVRMKDICLYDAK